MYTKLDDLMHAAKGFMTIHDSGVSGLKTKEFRDEFIDTLITNAVFNSNMDIRDAARWLIWHGANECGVWAASINDLYFARGKKAYANLTVPAVNVRGMTYDVARAMFSVINHHDIGAFIFEIARSEIGYTEQRPAEYAAAVLTAAVKSGYVGPVCIQGDHFQFKAKSFLKNPQEEINTIKALVMEAVEAGFYNIDIDASTLVNLDRPTVREQQKENYELTTLITDFVRKIEPEGVTVSLGGEIGEVGKKNSTVEEMQEYMQGHLDTLKKINPDATPISKISVQSGTSHGGVVLPDGSIADVKLDFNTLEKISAAAIEKFGISGAVQHGASTLPKEAFDKFPETQTSEIHLATGFQNIIYDHDLFPADIREKIYDWLKINAAGDRKDGQTEEQFYYKTRKKGFGPFKQELWNLPGDIKEPIMKSLEKEFALIFGKLGVYDSRKLVNDHLKKAFVPKPKPLCML